MTSIQQQIDAVVREQIAERQITGLAIGVSSAGQPLFSAGYGVQDLSSMRPVRPETLFHLASVVKTMTSTAIMQLWEAGRIGLDDPVVQHLPYFKVHDPRSDQISIRQCLTHTSGIGHPEHYGWDQPEFDDLSLERHVRSLAEQPLLELQPGVTSYSDIAYNVLGALIAEVSGMSYEAYMQQYLFEPLGMTKTTSMAPREADPLLLALGYEQNDAGAVQPSLYPYNRMHVPCGCIASNVLEMTRYALAHLNRGQLDGARILAPETYATMWAIQVQEAQPDAYADTALGWWVPRKRPEWSVEHDGGDDGFESHFALWPDQHRSIVVLSNSTWSKPWLVTEAVAEVLRNTQ